MKTPTTTQTEHADPQLSVSRPPPAGYRHWRVAAGAAATDGQRAVFAVCTPAYACDPS